MLGITVLIGFLAYLPPLIAGGKSCPEATRPHLTRCDKYFRCVQLPSGNVVWIPNQCDTGLIYEASVGVCVLPGDDWECNLPGDHTQAPTDDNNIYGVNNLEYLSENLGPYVDEEDVDDEHGSEVSITQPQLQDLSSEDEFSGDGDPVEVITERNVEEKVGLLPLPISSTTDSELSTHLQRLTQLIDNFHKNKTTPDVPVLHPDDLNSFLALHNIRNQAMMYNSSNKISLPNDGKIHPDTLTQILEQQNKLHENPNLVKNPLTTSRVKQKLTPDGSTIHVKSAGLSRLPFRPDSYSNSQIVVNRPEGAVLFNVARPRDTMNPQQKPEPYISENTLRTVLELSKQLVSTNHQVVPPVIYTIPIPYPAPPPMHTEDRKRDRNVTKAKDPPEAISVTVKEPISSTPPPPHYYIDSYGVKYSPQVDPFPLSYSQQDISNYYPPYPPLTYTPLTSSYSNYPTDSAQVASYTAQGYPASYNLLTPPTFGATSQYQVYGAPPIGSGASGQIQPANYNFGSTSGNNQQMQTSHNWHNDDKRYQQREPDDDMQNEEIDEEEIIDEDEESMESKETLMNSMASMEMSSEPPPGFAQVANQLLDAEGGRNKVINLRGNYFSYDTYRDTILPLLSDSDGSLASSVEILSCSMGVRQANATDCTRYFVCNPKTGDLLSYTCPPFTAFNSQSRICDARTYASCNPSALQNRFTISENKRLHYEAQKALEEAKRVRDEALKAQRLATLIKMQAESALSQKVPTQMVKPTRVTTNRVQSQSMRRPAVATSSSTTKVKKKKRFRCEVDGGAVPDTTSRFKYIVCFKGSGGKWRRHFRTCSEGLMFCPLMRKCTLQRKCYK
ncbi:uncharacterized protein LOC129788970 [Lutzomyia longipalpis]|uniref:uncharacterized protein LOC129788970 n=1 Tax=Lutzomyia longipalpis TaxID=7200 RepID=UPI0024841DCC|nr:uncharacterized protein LOC129788970 [Lutzomyia longipalpis]